MIITIFLYFFLYYHYYCYHYYCYHYHCYHCYYSPSILPPSRQSRPPMRAESKTLVIRLIAPSLPDAAPALSCSNRCVVLL